MPQDTEVVKEEKRVVSAVQTAIDSDRILSFSDAIFAFAATLLVLKIDLPQIPQDIIAQQLPKELINLWPAYFANIISFLFIGYYWLSHHNIFSRIKRFDMVIIWLNILLLISVAFLPFPIDLFGDFSAIPSVVIFYSACLAIAGYLLAAIWWYASFGNRLIDKNTSNHVRTFIMIKTLIAPVVFTISIPVAMVDVQLAKFSWILVVLSLFVLDILAPYFIKQKSRTLTAVEAA